MSDLSYEATLQSILVPTFSGKRDDNGWYQGIDPSTEASKAYLAEQFGPAPAPVYDDSVSSDEYYAALRGAQGATT